MFSGTISQGDFGPVPPEEIEKVGGVKNYNLMMDFTMLKVPGVLHKSGTKIHAKSMFPGKPGKLLWFSGPPGAGKSITAQLLARNNGYVYYEADCMSIFVNPFIDIHTPEPSMAQLNQKPLKGLDEKTLKGIEARSQMALAFESGTKEGMKNFDRKEIDRLFTLVADATCVDINRQRERLGGDWTVAFAIYSKAQRDIVRKALDNNVIFFILHLTDECNKKRLHARHAEVMDNNTA